MTTVLVKDTFQSVETTLNAHTGEIGATWTPTSNTALAVPNDISMYFVNVGALGILDSIVDPMAIGVASPSGSEDLPPYFTITVDWQWFDSEYEPSFTFLLHNDLLTNDAYGVTVSVNPGNFGFTMVDIVSINNGVVTTEVSQEGDYETGSFVALRTVIAVQPGIITVTNEDGAGLFQTVTWEFDSSSALEGGNVGLFLPSLDRNLEFNTFELTQNDPPEPPPPPGPESEGFFLSPFANGAQFFDSEGDPLAGGFLYSYIGGSSTPKATYTTETGDVENPNPIELDSAGRVQQAIWQQGGFRYKYHVTDADGNTISTLDNIPGINDVQQTFDIYSEDWIDFEAVPVRVDDDTFTINGNWSTVLHSGRRVKIDQVGGSRYGTVLSISVTEPTPGNYLSTVNLQLDTGTLSSAISQGFYSAFDSVGSPIPVNLALNQAVSDLQAQMAELQQDFLTLQAETLELLPIGAIVTWPTTSAPDGWSLCDGNPISRTGYAALYGVIGTVFGTGDGVSTFNKPDLRGKFVRGYDDGAGVDPGRGFATYQGDDNKAHTHSGVVRLEGGQNTAITLNRGRYWTAEWATGRNDAPFTNATGTESRPKNVALNYIIRTGVSV